MLSRTIARLLAYTDTQLSLSLSLFLSPPGIFLSASVLLPSFALRVPALDRRLSLSLYRAFCNLFIGSKRQVSRASHGKQDTLGFERRFPGQFQIVNDPSDPFRLIFLSNSTKKKNSRINISYKEIRKKKSLRN